MEPFAPFTGKVICLDQDNIDTDQILPKQFMRRIESSGYGDCLFHSLRYNANGELVNDCVFNDEKYRHATILVTGENFGCGSARQHAVWALRDFGIKVLVAPSFAGNFYVNCFHFGLLPAIVSKADIDLLLGNEQEISSIVSLHVDLYQEKILTADSSKAVSFQTDPFYHECLLEGSDQIDVTLKSEDEIDHFESRQFNRTPWYWNTDSVPE